MSVIGVGVLLAGLLLLLGISSSKLSARVGLPVLVVFLAIGMLAGSEGVGGIPFEDYRLANHIGSLALALILFDGGLRTSAGAIRLCWRPAVVISTLGVVVTAILTGVVATLVLGVPPLHGILLGGIVGSTDAAAVFAVFRSSGLRLPERLAATLELESGSNDPMAVFVTLGLIGMITGETATASGLLLLFLAQFGVGTVVGLLVGRAAVRMVNGINLEARGLYPLLVVAFGLLAFGAATALGGSGFLAVYLAGIVLGNSPLVFRRGICLFHDAIAWLSQIVLFVMLGLLSFPSRLAAAGLSGLVIAVALIFVARPFAVGVLLLPFRFSLRESILLSWGGLKGAVPITLATFPLLAGVSGADLLFDVVFFVVIVSALVQGWSLPVVARKLGLGMPAKRVPPVRVEVHALRHLDGDIVDYTVGRTARIAGCALQDLALPDGVAVTLVVRGEEVIVPRGSTSLVPGDHVFVALRNRLKAAVDRLFAEADEPIAIEPGLEMSFDSKKTVGQICRFLDAPWPARAEDPVGRLAGAVVGSFRVLPRGEDGMVTVVHEPQRSEKT